MQYKIRLNFFLIFFGCYLYLNGQNFGERNSQWVFDHSGFLEGVTKVRKDRDTLINNRLIKIFQIEAFREDFDGSLLQFALDDLYIRETNGIIEFTEDLSYFDTLYNFELKIGEKWTIPERDIITGEPTGFTIERTVVDTFSILLNGVSTFCQSVQACQNCFVDTIYQDIGTSLSYILPFDSRAAAADAGEGGVLRCFSDDRIGILNFESSYESICPSCQFSDFEYDCDQLSNNTPVANNYLDIEVFPNPSDAYIQIESRTNHLNKILLFDLQGNIILSKKANTQSHTLDIRLIPSGMYILVINDLHFEKVIIE